MSDWVLGKVGRLAFIYVQRVAQVLRKHIHQDAVYPRAGDMPVTPARPEAHKSHVLDGVQSFILAVASAS